MRRRSQEDVAREAEVAGVEVAGMEVVGRVARMEAEVAGVEVAGMEVLVALWVEAAVVACKATVVEVVRRVAGMDVVALWVEATVVDCKIRM